MLESGSWGHSVLQTPALVSFLTLPIRAYPQGDCSYAHPSSVNNFLSHLLRDKTCLGCFPSDLVVPDGL